MSKNGQWLAPLLANRQFFTPCPAHAVQTMNMFSLASGQSMCSVCSSVLHPLSLLQARRRRPAAAACGGRPALARS